MFKTKCSNFSLLFARRCLKYHDVPSNMYLNKPYLFKRASNLFDVWWLFHEMSATITVQEEPSTNHKICRFARQKKKTRIWSWVITKPMLQCVTRRCRKRYGLARYICTASVLPLDVYNSFLLASIYLHSSDCVPIEYFCSQRWKWWHHFNNTVVLQKNKNGPFARAEETNDVNWKWNLKSNISCKRTINILLYQLEIDERLIGASGSY